MKKIKFVVALVFALSLCALLLAEPKDCSKAVVSATEMCLHTLIPALFPFLFLSQFCLKTGIADKLASVFGKPIGKLFNLPDCAVSALFVGFLGGYPVGAKFTAELYKSGYIERSEAEDLMLCCNNCGPAFFLGAIGTAVFSSSKIGLALWLCHILSALLAFLILRRKKPVHKRAYNSIKPASLADSFCLSSWNAAKSAARISVYVILFNIFTLWINKLIAMLPEQMGNVTPAIKGLFELTSGIVSLKPDITIAQVCLAAFITGWGGVCVHMQTVSVMQGTGIKLKGYITAKFIQAVSSTALISIVMKLTNLSSVSAVVVHSKAGALDITAKSGTLFVLPWLCLVILVPVCLKQKEKDDDAL